MNKGFIWLPIIIFLFGGCSESVYSQTRDGSSGDTWLIMLYQDADDSMLEQDIVFDLNEAEMAGSSAEVTIVSQMDRFDGSFDGDGDWSGTRRYLVKLGDDMDNTESLLLDDLGEVNMSDGDTLSDYCLWAIENYPADKYALILSDHGAGWPGGWSDPDPDAGDMLWVYEMTAAMDRVLSETGLAKLDLVGFDACLMGQLEVFDSLSPYFRYAVASQETEPGMGWAYRSFLQDLIDNPQMNGDELAKSIVRNYIHQDLAISIDIDRYYQDQDVTEQEYADHMASDTTLSAIDLSQIAALRDSINDLIGSLQWINKDTIARVRSYTQSFTNIFDESEPSPYIDLGHFLSLLEAETDNTELSASIAVVEEALAASVIAEKHGEYKPGASGISIHFPNSTIYQADWGGIESYRAAVPLFTEGSQWDEYLDFYYSGLPIETEVVETTPEEPVEVYVPGYGSISIDNLMADQSQITTDDILTVSADITGNNIAYIYLQVLYYDPYSDYYLIADMDFIEADETIENNGVYYPDWSSEGSSFELVFEWEPYLYSIDNGEDYTFALLSPYSYGSSAEDALYTVEGQYFSAQDQEEMYAVAYFTGEGYLKSIFGYNGSYGYGMPHEIRMQEGDEFAPYENWVSWDELGEALYDDLLGDYLMIEDLQNPLEWFEEPGYIGDYYLGFIVEDYEGNQVSDYVYVEIVE